MKKVVTKTSLKAPSQDRAYWLSRSPSERFAAVEALRQAAHADIPDAEQRLQRVVKVIQRTPR